MPDAPVVVVGAGLAGLSAACHIAGAGREVVVLEASTEPGGRAGVAEVDGYCFDTGPVVLTMPDIVERCFAAAGVEMSDFLTLRPVDPMYRACFADGSVLRVWHGRDAMAEEIRDVCGSAEAQRFVHFCEWLTRVYELEMPNFIERNFDSPLDILRPVAPLLQLVREGGFRRLDSAVGRFFRDERLQRIFTFQSLYAGLSPDRALALFSIITYMDTVGGVYLPDGGMRALPRALARAAEKAGASVRLATPVERILLESGEAGPVRGVRLTDGSTIDVSAVVCTVDLPAAYRTLLPGLPPPRVIERGRYSPSALVWHAGVRGELANGVEHHNIHFGGAWRDSFRALFREGRRMSEPSTLVTVPTLSTPEMAPPGRHVLYALEPVPNLDGQVDWRVERHRARDDLIARLAVAGYPSDVDVELMVDPVDWKIRGMERGTPFGLSHTFLQSGPFRPPNRERRAPGLFFAGSGTVPGVGIPMVLLSGMLAARRVAAFTQP